MIYIAIYVCTVHISTKKQELFCLDAKTLVQTSELLKHQNIVVATDNDEEGIRAAKATGLAYAVPEEEGLD